MLLAIGKVNADTVFVLPDNSNIILAANQAAELTTEKKAVVLPTKTIPQGITAVINYVAEHTVEENSERMLSEMERVKTGQVTYAVRDTVIEGKQIRQGDYMGIADKGIKSVGTDLEQVALGLTDAMMEDGLELISIYYGSDVLEADAKALHGKLEAKYPNCDVELQYGGQPVYYYIISAE